MSRKNCTMYHLFKTQQPHSLARLVEFASDLPPDRPMVGEFRPNSNNAPPPSAPICLLRPKPRETMGESASITCAITSQAQFLPCQSLLVSRLDSNFSPAYVPFDPPHVGRCPLPLSLFPACCYSCPLI